MTAILLAAAMALDALAGEPRWLWARVPHPAVLMGLLVGALDRHWNAAPAQRAKGVAALVVLMSAGLLIGLVLSQLGGLVSIVIAAVLLAQKSLIQHVRAVADGLRLSDTAGRRAVAMIVSRDVSTAKPSSVSRSAIESLSENFSDGVIAPAFWFLVAGLPGIIVYKIVNTADSMIGYLTPRHAAFGWAAARIDDVLNWIPARLTAALIAGAGGSLRHWQEIVRDAALHRSPNAGWPEAAMAQALGIALAGPRSYDGQMQDLAWVNGDGRHTLGPADIDAAILIVWKAWGLALCAIVLIGGFSWVF
ncbi:adenosylcobinamide-phosphate synthase CbiB [uncultured Tateyamaria sp.]|uniref:adenosylcobinamide-phosphate synthase CbiB n=1 Tax=uncultured Tateyamaria sp. TaxID=455651 RepID=UPI002628D79F|nr:adenosylcobinamide-phosphate synthase CbiB [uncultured Tateyamaria sp.]